MKKNSGSNHFIKTLLFALAPLIPLVIVACGGAGGGGETSGDSGGATYTTSDVLMGAPDPANRSAHVFGALALPNKEGAVFVWSTADPVIGMVLYRDAAGSVGAVSLDSSGRATRIVANGVTATFSNYTSDTVDITYSGNGQTFTQTGVPYSALTQNPAVTDLTITDTGRELLTSGIRGARRGWCAVASGIAISSGGLLSMGLAATGCVSVIFDKDLGSSLKVANIIADTVECASETDQLFWAQCLSDSVDNVLAQSSSSGGGLSDCLTGTWSGSVTCDQLASVETTLAVVQNGSSVSYTVSGSETTGTWNGSSADFSASSSTTQDGVTCEVTSTDRWEVNDACDVAVTRSTTTVTCSDTSVPPTSITCSATLLKQ